MTLAAPTNVTLYYTLDGSDPRQSQGAISPHALIYTSAIPLRTNVSVIARARNPDQRQIGGPPISSPWSSPVTAKFVITAL